VSITHEQKAAIVAACIIAEGESLTTYQRRELERAIAADEAKRERYKQKMRSPQFHWKKPVSRRI
jgi:ADP-ribosylglycohydrolase